MSTPKQTQEPAVQDPVCGMWFPPSKAVVRREHQGTLHHFCSTSCATRFRPDPAPRP